MKIEISRDSGFVESALKTSGFLIDLVFLLSLMGFLVYTVTAHAGGGGMSGGATEGTQMLNHALLIEQVGHAVDTVSNTLSTAEATMQQIRQLDPGTISAIVGAPIGTVNTMAKAYGVFSKASSVYTNAAAVLQKAQSDAAMLKVSPSTLLNMKAQTAYAYGGQYKASYDAEQAKLAALASTSADVQKAANSLGGINSTVAGVQTLAAQNIQMQAQLTQLNQSIAQANVLAYQQAIEHQEQYYKNAQDAARMLDAYKVEVDSTPPVSKIQFPNQINLLGK